MLNLNLMFNLNNNKKFLQMDKTKQEYIVRLYHSLEGKNITEAIPVITEWKQQVTEHNICFTNEEQGIVRDIFMEFLTPAQKKQYGMLMEFLKNKS